MNAALPSRNHYFLTFDETLARGLPYWLAATVCSGGAHETQN